jgi:protein-tyrosine-phosphatase
VLATSRLRERGFTGIACASAGINTRQAARPPDEACEVAVQYGLSLTDHRPQRLTRELVDANDLIVVMEAGQLESIRRAYPDAVDRTVLLSLFDRYAKGGYARYHIADPYSQPRVAFEECYRRIDHALAALLSSIGEASPDRN